MRQRSFRNRSAQMSNSRSANTASRDRSFGFNTERQAKLTRKEALRRLEALSELPEGEMDHPAAQAQPAFNKYEKGDTSAWGEDVHTGPYTNSAHPATPDEGPSHPAYKSAREMARLERKASKCVRIAELTLGKKATTTQIENKALSLMDTPDAILNRRLASMEEKMEEQMEWMDGQMEEAMEESEMVESMKSAQLLKRLARLESKLVKLAEEEEKAEAKEESKEEVKEESKEEAKKKATLLRRLSYLERKLQRLAAEEEESVEEVEEEEVEEVKEEAKKKARLQALRRRRAAEEDAKAEGSKEEKKEEVKEEKKEEVKEEKKEEAKKKAFSKLTPTQKQAMFEFMMEMMGEDFAPVVEEEIVEEAMAPEMAEMMEDEYMMEPGLEMMSDLDDPMGIMEDSMSDQEMMILSRLFGKNAEDAEKKKEDEAKAESEAAETVQEEVEADAKEKKEEAKKKASLKPQPKKAATGATRLGGVSKEASDDISDLSKLWTSAPDIRRFF